MKTVLVVLALVFPALTMCFQAKTENAQSPAVIYELYSWHDADGGWRFSVLTMTDRAKNAEEIFDKQQTVSSVAKLKQKISKMPRGTRLVWMKNPYEGTSIKGTESVAWPPEGIMNEVKQFAQRRHVEVVW
jgi:hypothetical protein